MHGVAAQVRQLSSSPPAQQQQGSSPSQPSQPLPRSQQSIDMQLRKFMAMSLVSWVLLLAAIIYDIINSLKEIR